MLKRSIIAASLAAALVPQVKADVFISEYIEGSSFNKGIELFNSSSASIDLSSYELKIYFNGNTSAGRTIQLEGDIPANSTFVLVHSSADTAMLDVANQQASGSWYNGDDAIVLEESGTVIDSFGQIGVDPGSSWSSNGVSSANNTLRRSISVVTGDTNPNDDFIVDTQWEGFGNNEFSDLGSYAGDSDNPDNPDDPEPPAENCGDETSLISLIQGNTDVSALVGETVSVEAVVVGDFQDGNQLSGFFLQEETTDMDADANTSEGIFVYDNDFGVDVEVGDLVRVAGTVQEFYGNTQLSSVTTVFNCGTAEVTTTQVFLPVDSADDWEATENMKVTFSQNLTVAEVYNLGRFGQISLASERLYIPTQLVAPGTEANDMAEQNALKRITLDDGSSAQNPESVTYPAPGLTASNTLRVGYTAANIEGVVAYSFGEYRIHPTSQPDFVATNLREEAPSLPDEGTLRIASFNVLNYFNGDGLGGGFPTARGADTAAEFERQKDKIVAAILAMDADIIGLMEIENDGFDANSAIADLVNAVNSSASTGNTYAFVKSGLGAEGIGPIGTDAITVGFIYRTETVVETGNAATISDFPFDQKNRQPLAQTFLEVDSGEEITVVVNHFKSKGSSCDSLTYDGIADTNQEDGQGNCNLTRLAAANELVDWLETNPTGVEDDDRLIIGDLNAYNQEDPVQAIIAKGYTNLAETMLGSEAYSYVFSGESGSLDHALASTNLVEKVTGISDWHINADEPRVLDYNEEYQTEQQVIDWYAPDAFRASDHDPVIIEIDTSSARESYTNNSDIVIPYKRTIESKIGVSSTGESLNISVTVDIKHSYIGDLKLVLLAPNGQSFLLRNYQGGSANDIMETYEIDAGTIERNGVWKLKVRDAYRFDSGFVDSWTITF
jgi:predicted extracellular nuclease